MWSASPQTIRTVRILSTYWQLLLKKYILLKKKDSWKQNMCKWGLATYMSDVLVFNVCWREEGALAWSRGVVHCDSGNHHFPTALTADLNNLCSQYFNENANFCPVSRNSMALVFGWCRSEEVPVLRHGFDSCVHCYHISKCCGSWTKFVNSLVSFLAVPGGVFLRMS